MADATHRSADSLADVSLREMRWLPSIAWSLLAGLLFAAVWPPIELWWLAFVAVAPLSIMAIRQPSVKRVVFLTILASALPWGFVHAWMIQLTPPGKVLLDLYCAAYTALFAVLLRRAARSSRLRRVPMTVLVPLLWSGTEYLRSTVVLRGYPWYTLGLPLLGSPDSDGWCAQSASLFGVHLLSTLAAMVAGTVVDWWRLREGQGSRASVLRWTLATLVVQAANIGYGAWVVSTTPTEPGPTVLVVQTDLSASNKNEWTKEDQERDTVEYVRATITGASAARSAGVSVDLVAWPETMVPGFGLEVDAIRTLVAGRYYPGAMYADALAGLQERLGVPLLVGASSYLGLRANTEREIWEWDRHHNSAYLIDGPPPYQRYDKLFLTPFGEEMPLISRWDWLEAQLLSLGAPGMSFDLMAGEAPVRFEVPWATPPTPTGPATAARTVRFTTPICFEDTSGPLCRTLCYEGGVRVADLMVNLSNDGWFGWSGAGRAQHVLHARMRAVELGIPMIRCANTGYSVAIEWNGRITNWVGRRPGDSGPSPAVGTGTMVEPLSVRRCDRVTLYGRIGELWPWLMVLATVVLTVMSRPTKRSASAAAA